jgi:DNA-binding transcriptional MerR regulator
MDIPLPIKDFCRLAQVSAHTLRYYERAGIMPQVERNAGGHRRYTERHLRWIRFLRHLRLAGMPVAAIRRYTALLDQGPAGDERRMKLLLDHRERVAGQLQELRGHLAVIDKKLRDGCGPDLERRIAARASTQAKRRKA